MQALNCFRKMNIITICVVSIVLGALIGSTITLLIFQKKEDGQRSFKGIIKFISCISDNKLQCKNNVGSVK